MEVRISGLSKRFPGVQALRDVSLTVRSGSCHALMGENGAGKSTLGKIIAGLYSPDEGEICLDGQAQSFKGPLDAVQAGVSMIHQELLFAENLSVADNLCLGNLPRRGLWIDDRKARALATGWLRAIGSDIDPRTPVGELPVAKQQLVQIAGGIGKGSKVLVFDEPTSSLSQVEADRLLELIRQLKSQGVTCIYVSHRLEEVLSICDTVSVLRDGMLVDTVPASGLSRDTLVNMMVGRSISDADRRVCEPGNVKLEVSHLTSAGRFRDVSLSVREGEIVGLAGLVGAGRTELLESIFGLDKAVSGEILLEGKAVKFRSPAEALAGGLGLIPEDRKRHGLVLDLNARENMSLPTLSEVSKFGWVNRRQEVASVLPYYEKMRVKAASMETQSITLSGGNQQKLVIAKWLAAHCEVLLVDEPTRGVDVGAKAEIHELLRDLATSGKAILLVSSDMPELLALSDRVVVLREGEQVGSLEGEALNESNVMSMMAGLAVA